MSELRFTKQHEWIRVEGSEGAVGITDYAQEQLGDMVFVELPEIEYKSAETTVKVPDNGYVVIAGLKNISSVDRRSETPILSQIPILSFFFSKKVFTASPF